MEEILILEVGLTGGIASGKSTIARILGSLGCSTVDADAIVADLYRPGEAGHAALIQRYGPSILRADHTIDRARLADLAFSSDASASELNALIHPLVRREQDRLSERETAENPDRDQILVVEAALLIEAGNLDRYDRIVVVDLPPEMQLQRAEGRGMSRAEATRRISHQMPREKRLLHADYVLDNS
ncbi:MAG: dephospho-CoA kinase, partial [Thermoanaerobaculia bacterium]